MMLLSFLVVSFLCYQTAAGEGPRALSVGQDSLQVKSTNASGHSDSTRGDLHGSEAPSGYFTSAPPEDRTDPRSDTFYDSLRAKAERTTLTKALHEVVFTKQKPSQTDSVAFVRSAEPFVPFEGKAIRNIRLRRVDVLAGSVKDTSRVADTRVEKALNRFRNKTKDTVIRSNLLLSVGASLDPYTMADTERVLRSLPFIEDALLYVKPVPQSPDSVDVIVVTKDAFGIGLGGSMDKLDEWNASLFDRNFLGQGTELRYSLLYDGDDAPATGHDVRYTVENIKSTFTTGLINYRYTADTELWRLSLSKKFLTPQTRHGGGADFGTSSETRSETTDDSTRTVPFRREYQDFWFGRSIQIGGEGSRTNVILSGRHFRQRFLERPEVTASTNHFYYNEDLLLATLSYRKLQYLESSMILSFGTTEDLPLGYLMQITSGLELGEFESRPYLGASYAWGGFSERLGYLSLSGQIGGLIDEGRLEEGVVAVEGIHFTNLRRMGEFGLRFVTRADLTCGIHRVPDEDLDLKASVRGIRSVGPAGTRRLTLGVESVLFAPWDFYRFRAALFGFTDFGFLGYDKQFVRKKNLFSSIGVGIRLRNESLITTTFNFRISYLLRRPDDTEPWDFRFLGSEPGYFQQLEVTKPRIARFN